MIPFSSWVRGLIASCAKTHETNNFTQPQNIKNGITIDSDSLSDGYKGYIKFTNNGDVSGVYGHVSATGTKSVILKAGSKKLGLGITDEGFHQLSDVNDDIDSLHSRVTKCEDDIADLQVIVGNLQVPSLVHEAIENDYIHAISSGGVYNALTALETRINKTIAKTCKEYIENALISSINFGTPKEISVSGDNLTYTPSEPGLMMIKFYRKGGRACTWYVNNVEKSVSGAGDGTVQQTYPCKANVEYKWHCDGGVSQALWIPLTFSIGEA